MKNLSQTPMSLTFPIYVYWSDLVVSHQNDTHSSFNTQCRFHYASSVFLVFPLSLSWVYKFSCTYFQFIQWNSNSFSWAKHYFVNIVSELSSFELRSEIFVFSDPLLFFSKSLIFVFFDHHGQSSCSTIHFIFSSDFV